LVAVALGVMMVALDATIIAVANPAIQSHLHAPLADIQWVTNGYLLALAVILITVGKVGDRFGHKKVFVIGMIGFALCSAAIGISGSTAKSISLVIAFRVAQGVFGAMLMPTALALMRETFPVEELNKALGVWARPACQLGGVLLHQRDRGGARPGLDGPVRSRDTVVAGRQDL
jgi:MFS family permease